MIRKLLNLLKIRSGTKSFDGWPRTTLKDRVDVYYVVTHLNELETELIIDALIFLNYAKTSSQFYRDSYNEVYNHVNLRLKDTQPLKKTSI